MHEMSLCESIIESIRESADREAFTQVRSVFLEIGKLAGVELDSMRFGFDVLSRGTLLENARLNIVSVPGAAKCCDCSNVVEIHERYSSCPFCGSFHLKIIRGDELRIKNLEVV